MKPLMHKAPLKGPKLLTYNIRYLDINYEERKVIDKAFKAKIANYTGIDGKDFCFVFASEEAKHIFIDSLQKSTHNKTDKYYLFYKTFCIIQNKLIK